MSLTIVIHEDDTFSILVPVIDKATGLAKDITGATLTSWVSDIHGNVTAANSTVEKDGPAGKLTSTFNKDILKTGELRYQARVVLGAESQIVADHLFTVLPSYG